MYDLYSYHTVCLCPYIHGFILLSYQRIHFRPFYYTRLLVFQLVQPAFQSILGNLRSGTLDKFKGAFGKALTGGQAFSSAASCCTQICMAQFDEESAGIFVVSICAFRILVHIKTLHSLNCTKSFKIW